MITDNNTTLPQLTRTGKIFNIGEAVIAIISVLGVLLKCVAIPGASVLVIFGFSSLAMLYMIFGLRAALSYSPGAPASISSLFGIAGFGAATLLMGIVFRLQFWPGAFPMLYGGFLMTIVPLAIVVLANMSDSKPVGKYIVRRYLRGFVPIVVAGLLITFTSQYTLNSWFSPFRNDPEFVRLQKACHEDRSKVMCDTLQMFYDDYYRKRRGMPKR